MKPNTLCFSTLLQTDPRYKPAADRLFSALDTVGIPYTFIQNTRDIWLRDFMPVQTRSGRYLSFRYDPCYLKNDPELKTDFRRDVSKGLSLDSITYSDIRLDGGNVVLSPSKTKAIISDRVFIENKKVTPTALVDELERLLEAQVVIIPSLKSDMTGHADGMVRFVSETTVLGNRSPYANGLEQRIKRSLRQNGIDVIDFPYFSSPKGSAVGCYLNFLETEQHLLLPVFGAEMDAETITMAEDIFKKTVIPIDIHEVAEMGGVLNCISWET